MSKCSPLINEIYIWCIYKSNMQHSVGLFFRKRNYLSSTFPTSYNTKKITLQYFLYCQNLCYISVGICRLSKVICRGKARFSFSKQGALLQVKHYIYKTLVSRLFCQNSHYNSEMIQCPLLTIIVGTLFERCRINEVARLYSDITFRTTRWFP